MLRELVDQDTPTFLTDLIQSFINDCGQRIEELRQGLPNNCVVVTHAAHTLKSTCANMGAFPLSEICQNIEECSQAGDAAKAEALFKDLLEEYQAVLAALQTLPEYPHNA